MTSGDGAWDYGEEWNISGVADAIPMRIDSNDRGYRIVEVKSLSMDVIAKLNDLEDLFALSTDLIMILARHY